MIRNLSLSFLLLFVTSCITTPPPNPAYVSQIDAYFGKVSHKTYRASGKFKKPMPYKVGQYVVTGISNASERSISKMALVGREKDGWIIETQTITPTSESTSQMLVVGLEKARKTGRIDELDIAWVKVKPHGQQVQTFEGALLALTKGLYKKALSGLEVDYQLQNETETVSVPAGRFQGTVKASSEVAFLNKKYQSVAWLHPSVPINGMVKSVAKDQDSVMVLLDFGLSGAKKSF
ncbi:MAG: hypothetical protein P8X55_20895 [Desulfosarcinaceae bacterium]